jgi:hypothetical protein
MVRGLWMVHLGAGGLDDTDRIWCTGALLWGYRQPLVVLEATPLTADGIPVGMETT